MIDKEDNDAVDRIDALRSAARRATQTFLDKAPPRSHGRVLVSEGVYLSYRRVERAYGVFVEYANGTVVALDKTKDKSLIDGCLRLNDLYKVVCQNAKEDAARAEQALDEALAFTESFE